MQLDTYEPTHACRGAQTHSHTLTNTHRHLIQTTHAADTEHMEHGPQSTRETIATTD